MYVYIYKQYTYTYMQLNFTYRAAQINGHTYTSGYFLMHRFWA